MREMFLGILSLIPMWPQRWTMDDSGDGRYQHHTGENPVYVPKVKRRRGKAYVPRHDADKPPEKVGPEWGHKCDGPGCRCGVERLAESGVTAETGLWPTYRGSDWMVGVEVAQWGRVRSKWRIEDPWKETKALLASLGVKGWAEV